jgi:23S rRNA pseudouridine1911/1915/1917 synthase
MLPDETSLAVSIPPALAGARLDRALADLLPQLSRERIKSLILQGHALDGEMRPAPNPALKVREAMRFTLHVPDAIPAEARAQAIDLVIVHEDDDLIVVDKPAGLVVHPAAGNLDGTLVNALLHHCAGGLSGIGGVARPGIVHRIDKDTSGLIVVAKNDRAHEGLAQQFKAHSIERRYLGITYAVPAPPAGRIETWIGRSDRDRKKMAVTPEGRGKRAITHYRTVEALDRAALIECRLETGRTHQVRVHMAHLGHPLLGDPAYGRAGLHAGLLASLEFRRQALHAAQLGFIHPLSGTRLSFSSLLPDDMQQLFKSLRLWQNDRASESGPVVALAARSRKG